MKFERSAVCLDINTFAWSKILHSHKTVRALCNSEEKHKVTEILSAVLIVGLVRTNLYIGSLEARVYPSNKERVYGRVGLVEWVGAKQ